MNLNTLLQISSIIRNTLIIFLLCGIVYIVPGLVRNINRVLVSIETTSGKVNKLVELQDTEKNKKSIEAGIALAASLQGTVRLVNTTTIPKLNNAADELATSISIVRTGVADNLASSNKLIVDSNGLILGLQPRLESLLTSANGVVLSGKDLIEMTKEKTDLTLDQINGIIASPEWITALQHLNQSSANIEEMTRELKESGKSAPGIMKALEEIAQTSSKYRKAVLLSQIVSSIGRAFF